MGNYTNINISKVALISLFQLNKYISPHLHQLKYGVRDLILLKIKNKLITNYNFTILLKQDKNINHTITFLKLNIYSLILLTKIKVSNQL